MKYQELIDKYSNPNYQSRGSLNTSHLTNTSNRLDLPATQYSSELTQLERSNHQRNCSRSSKDYNPVETRSYGNRQNSPLPGQGRAATDSNKESIFKSYRHDTSTTAPSHFSPKKQLGYEDLRKTTGNDISIRERIQKNSSQSQHSSLLVPSSGQSEDYILNRDKRSNSKMAAQLAKIDGTPKYSQDLHLKENSPPEDSAYMSLSNHSKKSSSQTCPSPSMNNSFKLEPSCLSGTNSPELRVTTSDFKKLDSPRCSPRLNSSNSKLDLTDLNRSSHNKSVSSKFSLEKSAKIPHDQLKKSDFQIGKCKGDGKFGKVFACRHIKTGTLYALKEIPKKLIQQNLMEDQLIREIKLQSYFHHSNLVKLYGFFSDETNIYLLMEYMEEGTLYTLLKKNKKFPEQYVSDRIRQVCTALHYLHDMDVVHRDIKLENVVLSNGVAKLCDFGWAALINGRRTTYCGTFDYAPPEIIQGKDYNQNVDLWSLGVMTFQMLTGQLPFYNISRSETIKNILNVDNKKINFPPETSVKAQDFIERLLRKNPSERIRIDTLLKHPFLAQNPNSKSYV